MRAITRAVTVPSRSQAIAATLLSLPMSMGRESAKVLDKLSKRIEAAMADVAAAQDLIREAFPVEKYGNAKAAVWAAYRNLKLRTERRARALWNGEVHRVDASEMDALRRAVLQRAREEHARTRRRIEQLETALRTTREDGSGAVDTDDQ